MASSRAMAVGMGNREDTGNNPTVNSRAMVLLQHLTIAREGSNINRADTEVPLSKAATTTASSSHSTVKINTDSKASSTVNKANSMAKRNSTANKINTDSSRRNSMIQIKEVLGEKAHHRPAIQATHTATIAIHRTQTTRKRVSVVSWVPWLAVSAVACSAPSTTTASSAL